MPAVLYSDHGADFTSTHLTRRADLKVQLIRAPGRPADEGKSNDCSDDRHRAVPTVPGTSRTATGGRLPRA